MKLIDNWREWPRFWSMRWIIASAFFSAVIVAYSTLPADWLPAIGPEIKKWLAVGALLTSGCAGVARVIKQKPPETVEPPRQASTP